MIATLIAAAAALTSAEVDAQAIPLAVEGRVNAAFPTGGPFADRASTAVGFGVSLSLQLLPNYALYGGYSRTSFDLDVTGARAVDSGFAIGLSAAYPGLFGFTPWLGSGLLLHTLDVEGATVGGGDTRPGFEIGGGVAVPVAPRVRLTPGAGYRRYVAPFITGDEEVISYFAVGAGLNVAF